ncbi:MAG: disulfide bond formation protein B, partial [Pseudomonadota bacterium]|nr:disulfide bond formation protein B [Pseudomonadota bacterium]
GPGSCAGDSGLNSAQSIEQLRKMLMAAPIVRCSEIPWSFFGLSIAAFNAITSMVLAILCAVSGMRQLKVESL